MENITHKPKLLSLLKTREDLYLLEEKIDMLTSLLGKVNTNLETQIKAVLDYISFDALVQDFQNLNLQLSIQADLENYLNLIKGQILSFKLLKLTLAITPTKQLLDEIYYWSTKNIGEQILLDVTTDKTIIAGGLVEFEGKYKDYSIKTSLEKYFTANPNLI